MKVLYIDSTVRNKSRTAELAEYLLEKLNGDVVRVKLHEINLPAVDSNYLSKRDSACDKRDFSDKMFDLAKQFAETDIVVLAAPFWDLSFPATVKQYFEHINVIGLTFDYSEDGKPIGLCKAKKLYYVTTAGGQIFSEEYGFGYIKALAQNFYGIADCVMYKAEGLDIFGADVDKIMSKAKNDIDRTF